MKRCVCAFFLIVSIFSYTNVLAGPPRPAPTLNGKPVDKLTAEEVRQANKDFDAKIKKGDSSAVQQKADMNNAFEKTPEGQRMKKEDELQKKKDELAILEKEEGAMDDKGWDIDWQEDRLEKDGEYWDPGHHPPSPPDGKIGPGGDRDKRLEKLRKEKEKARKAREEAERKIKDLKKKIGELEDELYVKSGDTTKIGKDGDKGKGTPPQKTQEKFKFPFPRLDKIFSGGKTTSRPEPDLDLEFEDTDRGISGYEPASDRGAFGAAPNTQSIERGNTQTQSGPACREEHK